ncbi:MAG: hypothetical protein WCG42_03745 [Parachlamydiaceae bacterium]
MNNFFYSLINLLVAVFFLAIGVITLITSWSTATQTTLVQLIIENSFSISLFGFAFIVIGVSVIAHIVINAKRNHYYIKSENLEISVDSAVVEQYLSAYWKQLFPQKETSSKVSIKNNKIYIFVDFPHLPKSAQKQFLERVQNDIYNLLAKKLNYEKEFDIAASFQ